MRSFICWGLLILLAGPGAGLRLNLETGKKYIYAYDLMPASDLKTISSSLVLAYPINERSAIEINYLSLENPFLAGSSYTVSYRLAYGLERRGILWPTLIFGYRFIYTPETDFVTPIDFGIVSEILLTEDLSFSFPVVVTLFSKDNLLDLAFTFENRGFLWGDLIFGLKSLKPVGKSSFVERSLLLLGIKNWF